MNNSSFKLSVSLVRTSEICQLAIRQKYGATYIKALL